MVKKQLAVGIIILLVELSIPSTSIVIDQSNIVSSDGNKLYVVGDEPENHIKIENEMSTKFKLSAGLAPKTAVNDHNIPKVSLPFGEKMWGYIVNSSIFDEGTCYFHFEEPSDIVYLHDTESDDFLSGGTGVCGKLIACENSTGALWTIDPETGDMTYIGGGGVGLNGLAMDYTSRILYGASGSGLYLIAPDNGDQVYIGDFGNGVNEMIGIACDENGNMYGWDLGDNLWTINIETGEATEVGPLGINLNYAQDGCFDYSEGPLFLTAYIGSPYNGSYICTCDLETGLCTVGDQIGGNSQITASVIYLDYCWHQHDIGIEDIISPYDGYASDDIEIIVKVGNHGSHSEDDVLVNVVILKEGVNEEYNETIYVDVGWQETIDVEMPKWTPDDWQNSSNKYIEYKIIASIKLNGDENPDNDCKEKWIELYFPYLHDVGAFHLGEMELGPAQTFPVKALIKNIGQNEECCFKTHVQISEIDFDSADFLLFEDFSPYYYFPPEGWTRTTTKWTGSSYNYCQQGDGGEARFYNYSSETNKFRLYSPPINTMGYGAVSISFVHYLNHYNGPYTLRIETSPDGNTWSSVWEMVNPNDILTPEWVNITTYTNVGGNNFHVSVTFDGCSWNTNWWHIDNVSIYGFPIKEPELTDQICIPEIIPGEEIDLEFDDWTPEFLQYEVSGQKTYAAKVWTQLDDPADSHRANDQFQKCVELDYFHDAAIQEVTSPIERNYRRFYAVDCNGYPSNSRFVWFNPEYPSMYNDIGTFPSTNLPQGATFVGDQEWVCDTNGNIYIDINNNPDYPHWEFVGNSGTGELVSLAYNTKDKTLYGMSTSTFYEIDYDTGKATKIGNLGTGTLMISCAANSEGVMYAYDLGLGTANTYTIDLETGKATVVGPTGVYLNYAQDMAYDFEEDKMYATTFNYNTFQAEFHEIDMDTGKFTYMDTLYEGHQTTCLAILSDSCCIIPFIPPGICSIKIIVANYGTFPERDMTCYASIDEYITDCVNGTNVYEDMIENINITRPLTGIKSLTFKSYNFSEEGPYVLTFEIVDDNDDKLKNNIFEWEIGVDDTPPTSSYTLDPPDPDGLNGWYVSDLKVTLLAEDPDIGCRFPGSGIKEIKYTINGVGDSLPGECGTFTLKDDGNDIVVEYWAVDWVGNVESKKSFTIDIDRTMPVINPDGVHWKAFRENLLSNIWYVRFWTNATDATSGMDRVEMYINEGLHEINDSPDGNIYEFVIMWSTVFETITFSWRHFDRAGWDTYDEILGNEPTEKSYTSEIKHFNLKNKISKNLR